MRNVVSFLQSVAPTHTPTLFSCLFAFLQSNHLKLLGIDGADRTNIVKLIKQHWPKASKALLDTFDIDISHGIFLRLMGVSD